MSNPQYDVIVFGATSFVGQILSRYLLDQFGTDGELRWALAGRSQQKLADLQRTLGPKAAAVDLLVADAADEAALCRLCEQTRVVISTVGPYALYGETLVKVCVKTGTDYCDLSGEAQWISKMVARYDEAARASGARIVHCCGFDSIPSDMGVFFLQQQARQRWGEPASRVKMRVKVASGGFSGGTVASIINVTKEALADPALRRELANPYSLCPPRHGLKTRQPNVTGAEFDADFQVWLAPFVMAGINTRIVHRSNALSGRAYGKDFQYDEAMMTGRGMKGRLTALGVVGGLAGFLLAAAVKPTRSLMENYLLPKPGEGPSPEAQEKGFFDLRFRGVVTMASQVINVKVTGDRDPGYGSTAKMLGQAGACLALDLAKSDRPGGFWTPSTAMGDLLLKRLITYAGLTFEVTEV